MPLEASLSAANQMSAHSSAVRRFWQAQETRLLLAILIGGAILVWQSEAFLTVRNLRSVLVGFSFVAIATLGQLLVILAGRIDLSAGSVMGLAGMVSALALASGIDSTLAVPIGVAVGAIAGLVNGLFSVSFGINAFIVTLGTMQVARGITIALTEGDTVSGFPDHFLALGSTWAGLPVPIWILLALAAVLAGLLRHTGFGRELFAIGGNEMAARLAGVAVKKIVFTAFIVSGAAAGLAGVLVTARLGAALGNAATGYELTIIASVVIGGASLAGGKGSVSGVLLGAMLIALVNNALVLLTVPTYWQQAFIGAVIIGAALIDRIRR
jgi:ribose/xylose/arabinose/galactoside ABC-type transport system permease subunit